MGLSPPSLRWGRRTPRSGRQSARCGLATGCILSILAARLQTAVPTGRFNPPSEGERTASSEVFIPNNHRQKYRDDPPGKTACCGTTELNNGPRKILAVTLSGVRSEEEAAVRSLIASCRLPACDLTSDKLRHFLVARKGDAVIGVVGLELAPPFALLRSLAVDEAHRRQGVATQLIGAAERYGRMMGATTLYLLTLTAESFFRQCQFEKASRAGAPESLQAMEEFKTLCPDTAVCMRKHLR